MRENVSLSHVDDYIFYNSHINEVMFEHAHIKATIFSLSGFTAKKIEIISTNWHSTSVANQKNVLQSVTNFEIKNSTFHQIVPGIMYNYSNILIDNSKVHHFAGVAGFACNIDSFVLQNSKVSEWRSHVIPENSKVDSLKIQNSTIDKFLSRSIFGAEINTLFIENCTIGRTAKRFIEKSTIMQLFINRTVFKLFAAESFAASYFAKLILHENKFVKLSNRAFGGIVTPQMQITECIFSQFSQFMFENSTVSFYLQKIKWKFR